MVLYLDSCSVNRPCNLHHQFIQSITFLVNLWSLRLSRSILVVHKMSAVPKPPLTPPAATYGLGAALPTVRFRHPAYPRSASDLLVLMATDGEGALDFDIAMVACCIVANMGWDDGYLAQKASAGNDALQQVDRPNDGLLSAGEYLFCIKGQDPFSFKYPVIPSFHHWRFPHGNLPSPWRNLQLPEFPLPRPTVKGPVVAMERDITCRVSGYKSTTPHSAHPPFRPLYIQDAVEQYRLGRQSLRSIYSEFDIPRSTIRDRLRSTQTHSTTAEPQQTLSRVQEDHLTR
ncbi:uncharacterized protein B0T15DRAFT_522082 [Chaetomium strumarium]|uniref:HTH psq-type domain-containing protein n=1 Tax=Chaetomium strumarium TaxID=1170767 RepID=A0AAJ0M783_9PEZI|nr:hypothetical protein B0T15DRAFT_522082 [Chaetomium strumarium]